MGSPGHSPMNSRTLQNKSKIPDYASEYKKEYLFIRGIDKYFEYFLINLTKATNGVFQNNRINIIKEKINILDKFITKGKLKDISNLEIDERDIYYSYILLEMLEDLGEYYINDYWEFDQEMFDRYVDGDFPGYKNLVECIELFHSKFKLVDDKYETIIIWPDGDSDSE